MPAVVYTNSYILWRDLSQTSIYGDAVYPLFGFESSGSRGMNTELAG